jgi:hypothetical protein
MSNYRLEKHYISLPSYLKMLRGFLFLAIDRGLLDKPKKTGSVLTLFQKRMYCELMHIVGLNFDSHRKILASQPGSPWGSKALPEGYADGSAFTGQDGDQHGLEVVFPPRLRLKDLEARAREVREKRGGVTGQYIELDAEETLRDAEEDEVVLVLPGVGDNPHARLERTGGGVYRGSTMASGRLARRRRRIHHRSDDGDEGDGGVEGYADGDEQRNRQGFGPKRARRSGEGEGEVEGEIEGEGEGGSEGVNGRGVGGVEGTSSIAVTEGAIRSNRVATGAGGGDGGGYWGSTKAAGMLINLINNGMR